MSGRCDALDTRWPARAPSPLSLRRTRDYVKDEEYTCTNAEAAKLALEYVLEVHDDLEDWQRMDPTLAQALDEGLSHCLDAMQSLVLLYQAMRDIEDDQLEAPPEVTAEADAHVEYLNSMLLPSIIDTTQYEN